MLSSQRGIGAWSRWVLALVCLLVAVSASAQSPARVSSADARAVRAVIEAQLAAFAADDAERAFSFAAPGIRETFGDAERFLTMVRNGYPVVYRPASVRFLEPVAEGASVLQRVRMTDAAGVPWLVVYELQRQPDGAWRIAACVAARGDGVTT